MIIDHLTIGNSLKKTSSNVNWSIGHDSGYDSDGIWFEKPIKIGDPLK